MTSKLLDVKQVQDMLGVSERTIFRLLKTGELTGFKAGREWRFEEQDITTYIANQRAKAQPKPVQENRGMGKREEAIV